MTAKLKRIKIFGEGIYANSPIITRQRRLNCYIEVRKDQDRSPVVLLGTPGMAYAFTVATPSNGPNRGLLGSNSYLYTVGGNQLLSVSSAGVTSLAGIIGTSAGNVSMAANTTQIMVVDGNGGYVYTPTTNALVTVGGSFPNGAKSLAQCNGFFLAEDPGTNNVFVSNLNDGTTWGGLSFFAAVQYPDGIVAVDAVSGFVVAFSYQHLEFWQNVGATQEPFQYVTNSATEYGLGAVFGRAHIGDSIVFLCYTKEGGYQVARIQGFAVKVVSTPDVDRIIQAIAREAQVSDCTMLSYQDGSHKFVQMTFPSANLGLGRSLLYDATEDLWAETQTGLQAWGIAQRHIGQFSTTGYGKTWIADYQNGNLYNPNPGVYQDNGNIIPRELVTPVLLKDFNILSCRQLYFDMETGVGLANPALQGYAPNVMIQRARDARNFGPERIVPLGQLGQYVTRVNTRRWGRGRGLTFRLRMTDPVKFVVAAGAAITRVRALAGGA